MVELYQFLLLNGDEKAAYLWENGDFITNLKEVDYSYNLYSLNGYYVDVVLFNAENSITNIIAFRKGERLDKYLNLVNINTLL